MVRPANPGCDYLPLDVDFFTDDKVLTIQRKHGLEGVTIVLRSLAELFGVGYCYKWSLAEQENLAFQLHCDLEKVQAVINTALDVNFYNKDLYEREGVLSSKGVQRRYLAIKKKHRNQVIKEKYNLLSDKEQEEETELSGVKRDTAAQSKVKESKVKESKDQEGRAQAREDRRDQVKAIFESRSGIWLEPLATNALKRWVKFRSELKKPITPSSLSQILESYRDRIPHFVEAVDFTIEKNWQGLRHPSESGVGSRVNSGKLTEPRSLNENFEIIAKRQAERAARAAAEAQNQNQN